MRLGWEAACHVPADDGVVRRITQIDDEIVDVRHAHSAVLEQGLDIVEQPDSLFLHVAEIEDIAISVDACRSGDECNLLVGKGEACAAFEGYTVFVGRIEMVQCLEVFLVFLPDVRIGQEVDGHGRRTCR